MLEDVSLTEAVEPLDWENVSRAVLQEQLNDSVYRSLVEFPCDDVEAICVHRPCRTERPNLPEPSAVTCSAVRDFLPCYTRHYSVLHRRYERCNQAHLQAEHVQGTTCDLTQQDYEVDIAEGSYNIVKPASANGSIGAAGSRSSWSSSVQDLRLTRSDSLIPSLLQGIAVEDQDRHNTLSRALDRQSTLFSLYGSQPAPHCVEIRDFAQLPRAPAARRVLAKFTQVHLDVEVEPLFVSAALYDASERRKVSETFHFDLNSDSLKGMLGSHVRAQDISSLSRSCIFNITHPSADLFLVLRIEKVLQSGDVNEIVDAYLKEDKSREKLKATATAACERLGRYRMPLAWTAVDLVGSILGLQQQCQEEQHQQSLTGGGGGGAAAVVSASVEYGNETSRFSQFASMRRKNVEEFLRRGSTSTSSDAAAKRGSISVEELDQALDTFNPLTLTVTSFFKQEADKLTDEDLFKYISDLKRPSLLMKRLKCLPGKLVLHLQRCPYDLDLKCGLSPELLRIHPYTDEKARPVKELLEFPAREVYAANMDYRNLLFVYPRNVNFSGRASSARNISICVQLMTSELDSNTSRALAVIYGRSSCPERLFDIYTSVLYHNKTPDFYDEIKLDLPADLHDGHHLLFTFYHISCQPRKHNEIGGPETLLGFSWVPLMRNGRLNCGDFSLMVSSERPSAALSRIQPELAEFGDRGCAASAGFETGSSYNLSNTKWLDSHKELFRVSLRCTSTIHSQDARIDAFLNACRNLEVAVSLSDPLEKEILAALLQLDSAALEPLVHFSTPLLDRLLKFVVASPRFYAATGGGHLAQIGQVAFETLGRVTLRISDQLPDTCDQHGRCAILASYVRYAASIPESYESSLQAQPRPRSVPSFVAARGGSLNRASGGGSGGMSSSSSNMDLQQSQESIIPRSAHEALLLRWIVALGGSCNQSQKTSSLEQSWFFFELLIRCMQDHLTNCVDVALTERTLRFSTQFTDDIFSLVTVLTRHVVDRYAEQCLVIRRLNRALAFFLSDLFTLMDRGFVMLLIHHYYKTISAKIRVLPDSPTLELLKMELLRIVCFHEHLIPLCLPLSLATAGVEFQLGTLSDAYRRQHFLLGLVLSELRLCLEPTGGDVVRDAVSGKRRLAASSQSFVGAAHCAELIRQLLASHEADPRYQSAAARSQIAKLYLPLLGIVSERAAFFLHDPQQILRGAGANGVALHGVGTPSSPLAPSEWDFQSAPQISSNRPSNGSVGASSLGSLSMTASRHLLLSCLWVLKNAERRVLAQWLCQQSVPGLHHLLDLLMFASANFEYKGKRKSVSIHAFKKSVDAKQRLEENLVGGSSARSELLRRKSGAGLSNTASQLHLPLDSSLSVTSTGSTSSFPSSAPVRNVSDLTGSGHNSRRWRKEHTASLAGPHWRSLDQDDSSAISSKLPPASPPLEPLVEANLALEMTLIVVDSLELMVQCLANTDSLTSVLPAILRTLLHSLCLNQSTRALQALLASQRALVTKFPEMLFEEEQEQCAELCLHLLRYCSSCLQDVRATASASLYMLMRHKFELGNNFARVKMQVTMALSSLVAQQHVSNEEHLRRSLKTVLSYSEADVELRDTVFPEQVAELVNNLHMILSDTARMREFAEDPEMLLDLMYRVAKGYASSPDLRLTWLHNMAAKHSELGHHAEAAHCLLHSAALVAEYLAIMQSEKNSLAGCVAFQGVSVNVLEESAVSDDVVSPEDEGVCCSSWFSLNGMVGLLEQAAMFFNMAALPESVNALYKLLINIHESNRDFQKLADIHGKLQDVFNFIVRNEGKRMPATYFRVAFFGSMFGELDGEEFVYKEPPLTKLPEIAHRLENFYGERFGSKNLVIIKDSNVVDCQKLETDKAYVQITYVEPHFESFELRRRITFFEKNNNLRSFVFATPFTLDGRAHGELNEQYKRRTVLTTSHAFPYLLTRLAVVARQQTCLTPVEVACEDLCQRVNQLSAALRQDPLDSKMLQMMLQGCVGTTVNQGPVEMAVVFLTCIGDDRSPSSKSHQRLRLAFKEFLRKSHEALTKNRALICPEQRDYQREMERNFASIRDQLQPLLCSADSSTLPPCAVAAPSVSSCSSSNSSTTRVLGTSTGAERRRTRSASRGRQRAARISGAQEEP